MSLLRKQSDEKPFTTGEQIGTYVNPAQILTGRVAVPDVANNLMKRVGPASQTGRDALYSALAMMGVYGAGAYGLQWAMAHTPQSAKPAVYKEQIKDYLNAGQPIMAPEPVTMDRTRQKQLESLGMGGALNSLGAQEKDAPPEAAEANLPSIPSLSGHSKEAGGEAFALALPVAAMVAGGYFGTSTGVSAVKKARQGQFDDKIEEAKSQLNALNYKALLRARGLHEQSVEPDAPSLDNTPVPGVLKEASDGVLDYLKAGASKVGDMASETGRGISSAAWGTSGLPDQRKGLGLVGGTTALATLGALGLLGGGAYFSKQYFDSNDPARKNLKKMRDVAREQALMEEPPVVMPMMSPDVLNAINAHINKTAPRKALQSANAPFDSADATMSGALQHA